MKIDELIAGDTLDFIDTVSEFPATDGWTLKYVLVPRFTTPVQAPVTLTATASGADYRVQAAAATTALWKPGDYTWSRWVEKSGLRQSLGQGQLAIKQDPVAAAQGFDGRSHASKVFDAIKAVLERRASKDQEEYAIEGRSLKRTPIAELLVLRDRYAQALADEAAADRLAAGLPNPRHIGVRFNRV